MILSPYKEEYGLFNANILLWQALFYASIAGQNLSAMLAVPFYDYFLSTFILSIFPLIYIIGVAVHHLYRKWCSTRIKDSHGSVAPLTSLSDRLLHSDRYRDSFGFISAPRTP